jgi:proline-specific peptidase
MTANIPVREGRIAFHGYSTWYRIVGDHEGPGKLPLLTLHGGPGAGHDYLESLDAIAATGRRVIYYDQLGCGNSSLPRPAPELWTIPLYVEEVGAVREALGLDQIHLLGQSWGGWLAQEYMLTQPPGVASLILAGTSASIPETVAEMNRLRRELPPNVQKALDDNEAAGTTHSTEYEAATMEFYKRHLCRLDPIPEFVLRTFDALQKNPEVYNTMNGPSEFYIIGTIKDWDVRNRLGEIRLPTLITTGRYDEITPAVQETLHRGIAGSEWVIFENSSHLAHAEEPTRYCQVLDEFLSRAEQ